MCKHDEAHKMSSIYMYMYEQKLAVHDHMNVFEGKGRGLFKCCLMFRLRIFHAHKDVAITFKDI